MYQCSEVHCCTLLGYSWGDKAFVLFQVHSCTLIFLWDGGSQKRNFAECTSCSYFPPRSLGYFLCLQMNKTHCSSIFSFVRLIQPCCLTLSLYPQFCFHISSIKILGLAWLDQLVFKVIMLAIEYAKGKKEFNIC